jgi:hypothetical protein
MLAHMIAMSASEALRTLSVGEHMSPRGLYAEDFTKRKAE